MNPDERVVSITCFSSECIFSWKKKQKCDASIKIRVDALAENVNLPFAEFERFHHISDEISVLNVPVCPT